MNSKAWALPAVGLACAAVAWVCRVPHLMVFWHVTVSGVCLVLYAADKRAARVGRRRVPEATLLAWGLIGGWPGAFAAQRLFRHKTAKASFQWAFRATVVVHLVALAGWHAAALARL